MLLMVEETQSDFMLDFGGEPVLVRGPEVWVDWLADQYGTAWEGRAIEPSVVIERRQPAPPPSRPANDHDGDGYSLWWSHEEMHVDRNGFRAWMARGQPGQVLVGATGRTLNRNMLRYSQYGMAWCLAHSDRLLLHCAAVAREDGALLLLGRSGAGKSTAVLAAITAGFEVLADDLVVVRDATRPTVTGVARHVVAPLEMIEAAGLAKDVLRPANSQRRRRAYLPRSLLNQESMPLRGMVLIDHDGGEGSVEEMAPPERAAAMVHGFAIPAFAPVVRSHFPMMARLSAMPMWRIGHAVGESERLRHAARALERIVGQ